MRMAKLLVLNGQIFDSSGIKYYAEGYTQDSSGTFEILKTIDFRKHTGCENYKINPDGSLEIQRKYILILQEDRLP